MTKYRINNQTLISYEYNDLGQITQKTELIDETADIYKISQYQYDDGQNLIEEKTGNTKYNYEYDSENRITKIFLNDTLETEFFYSDFSTLIKENNGLETLLKYNSRFDLIEKTETDTILNQTHTTTYTYDARHLLVEENTELKHNNFIKSQARYSASGLQEGILIFSKDSKQGFYRIYKTKGNEQNNIEGTFDLEKFQNQFPELLEKSFYKWTDEELNILIDFSESKKESSQEYIAKENAVRIIDPLNREILYKYNSKNQLESMTNFGLSQNSDFQKISYSYTKSGLLESSTNQFGGKIEGAVGTLEKLLTKACTKHNIFKINTDTDIRLAYMASIRKHLSEHPENFDIRKPNSLAIEEISDLVFDKNKNVFKNSNKI